MPVTTNTTGITTITATDVYTQVDAMRSVVREQVYKEINGSDVYQFMKWLINNDPEVSQKFVAFKTAQRMGVVR